jgi:CubicO group peptidase (beta-lactamase class C family)
VTQTFVSSPKVSRDLAVLERRFGEAKPSVYITDQSGTALVDWSMSPLRAPLAGISKLYTLAMVLRECDRGAMSLDTPITDLLDSDTVGGLCVVRGKDLSHTITVAHLIGHQSGIRDYYRSNAKGTLSFEEHSRDRDRAWSADQALEIAKHYPGLFAPGAKKKVGYSHTNYLLLGLILSDSTGMSFEQLINLRISGPLGLKATSVFTPSSYDTYFSILPVRMGSKSIRAPRSLASFGAAGSLVATAKDAVSFMRAFWAGKLFDPSWLEVLQTNQRKYLEGVRMGMGLMIGTRNNTKTPIVGHIESSGTALLLDTYTGMTGFLALNTAEKRAYSYETLARIMGRVSD